MASIQSIIGLTVKSLKASKFDERFRVPRAICFSDGKTYILLKEQDERDYHDCDCDAKIIEVCQDEEEWARIDSGGDGYYIEATGEIN